MTRAYLVPVFCFIALAFFTGFTDGKTKPAPTLKWLTFDQGIAEAEKSKKKILVDIYTDWCGFCKKMDREVYADQEVIAYLSKYFEVVKLHGESDKKVSYKGKVITEADFSRMLGVGGYPTTAFFEPKGELITPVEGYLPKDKFMPILRFIGEGHYEKMEWNEFLKKDSGQQGGKGGLKD